LLPPSRGSLGEIAHPSSEILVMHRDLKKLLPSAHGASGFIVALFLDVRGFSSFARMAESSETAIFLRSTYIKILDNYFDKADFFKPSGDGLMIIREYSSETLNTVVNEVVATSVRLVHDFPTLCNDDPMINFKVPQAIGIGIARGAATRLQSGRKTLDYSGRPLNLAARLMDLARPRGVVLESSVGVLLGPDLSQQFQSDDVFVQGVADTEPVRVFFTAGLTEIPEANKRPLAATRWIVDDTTRVKLKELKARGLYTHRLSRQPANPAEIFLIVAHPKVLTSGRPHPSLLSLPTFSARFKDEAGKPAAQVDYNAVARKLSEAGVKDNWDVDLEVRYQAAPERPY
jgi:class 3 adenylate cyclase